MKVSYGKWKFGSFAEEEDGKGKRVSRNNIRQAMTRDKPQLGRIMKQMKGLSFKGKRNDKAGERLSLLLKEGEGKAELSIDVPENTRAVEEWQRKKNSYK